MTSDFSVAVHALVFLYRKGGCLSSEKLGENICTNPARVRKVMAKLKKAGLVHTKEGIEGGYSFCKGSGEVTLQQISEALGIRFVQCSWSSGGMDKDCLIALGMGEVMDGLYDELDALCKQRLAGITVADMDKRLFAGK
ncbi:MAG TPA: Rrf2 family transcriptional regulator [Candidatus Gallacutalibacter stercoravium]|nr:Rrf2 family transcriptional regulator [Candidatus Gallacutalibacter stercoravium]